MIALGRKRVARFGPFELDLESGELRKQGVRVQLQPKPQQLLLILLENAGTVTTREELQRRLWGDDTFVDFESGLNTAANRLRIRLGDSAEHPRYIETFPRVGYRFIAPVEMADGETPGPPPNGSKPVETVQPSRRRLRPAIIAVGMAAVALAIVLVSYARSWPAAEPRARFRELTFRRGQVLSARFAPDGQNILYTAQWEQGPRQLFLTGASGPESRSLGLSDLSLSSVSPGGELALLQFGGTMNIAGGTLFRVNMNASARSYVDRGIMTAEWTRDGKQLIVVRAIDGRNQLEYPAGNVVYRTVGWLSNVRTAPASEAVAFVEHPVRHDDSGRIMLFESGRDVRALTGNWTSVAGLAWHPSRKEIWFTAARDGGPRSVWAITTGGRLRAVAQAPGVLTLRDIAPDGRVLITRDIRRLEMAGQLAGESGQRDFSWLDWSRVQEVGRDARLVLFDESGEGASPHSFVYLHHTRDGTTTRLGEGIAMGLSPDENSALVVTEDHQHLQLIPVNGGAVRRLRDSGLRYQWVRFFPDGGRLLTLASRPQEGLRLYVLPLDDATPTAISPEMMVRNAAISPDGEWVSILTDKNELVLYPAAAKTAPRIIPTNEPLAPLRWTADGLWLFVRHLRRASDNSALISRLEVSTGRTVPWRTLEPADRMGVNAITGVALAPDCQSYVYSYRRVLSELFLVGGW